MDDETKAAFAVLLGRMNDGFGRIENKLTAIQDDIAVAMASSDQMQRVNANTRADLRSIQEQVSIMWKQVKRLETRVDDIEGGHGVTP
jgi:phage-related tail protein